MYRLLTEICHIHHTLAITLINYYGGHIYDIYRAIIKLNFKKEDFVAIDSELTDKVLECLKWRGKTMKETNKMKIVLRQLAVEGFYPLKDRNCPIAKVISYNNVGGKFQ